jgi:hypothetical protein
MIPAKLISQGMVNNSLKRAREGPEFLPILVSK